MPSVRPGLGLAFAALALLLGLFVPGPLHTTAIVVNGTDYSNFPSYSDGFWFGDWEVASAHEAYEIPGHNCANVLNYPFYGDDETYIYSRLCDVGGCRYYMPYGMPLELANAIGCRDDGGTYCGERRPGPVQCFCDDACCSQNDCCWNNVLLCKSPIISSAQPARAATGPAGTTVVTLSGEGFSCRGSTTDPPAAARVTMHNMRGLPRPADEISPNAVSVPTTNVLNSNQLQVEFLLPEGYGPDWYFFLVNCYELRSPASANLFSYTPPQLNAISPSSGATRGGVAVGAMTTIKGTSFGSASVHSTGVTVARFYCTTNSGGTKTVATTVTSGSSVTGHTDYVFHHPAGEGVCSVSLEISALSVSVSRVYFSYRAPQLKSVTPSTALLPGTRLTIVGTDFGVSGTNTITVNGVECVFVSQTTTGTGNLDDRIICTAPNGSRANQPVMLMTGSQYSNVLLASYAAPIITSVSPVVGVTAGNTAFTINGSGFYTEGILLMGGTTYSSIANASMFTSWAPTRIILRTPPGQGKNVAIYLLVGDQLSDVNTAFSYTAPTIASMNPVSGNAAARVGSNVVITGNNFGLSPAATINGLECVLQSSTHTTLSCTIPSGYGTAKPVVVTVGGQASAAFSWSYAPPLLQSRTPTTGATEGGYALTLVGLNFGDTGSVFLSTSTTATSGINCISSVWNVTTIICALSAGSGKNLYFYISSGGYVTRQTLTFSYSAPTLTSVTPTAGPTGGGTQLVLVGTNFGTGTVAQSTGVTITYSAKAGGSTCTLQSRDHSLIICTTNAGYGTVHTLVVTIDTQAATHVSGTKTFSYDLPVITTITNRAAPTSASPETLMTIIGTSFGATNGTVRLGSVPYLCPATEWSHSRIVCRISPGAGGDLPVTVVMGYNSSVTVTTPTYTMSYNSPSIVAVTPNPVVSAGTIPITVQGSNFGPYDGGTTVAINGNNCAVTSQTHSQIVCTSPPGWGTGLSLIVNARNQASNSYAFSYSSPVITSITPSGLTPLGGVDVTVVGTSFGPGTPAPFVSFGSADCVVKSRTHTQIVCTLPPGAGTVAVQVTVDVLVSNYFNYNYATPTILSAGAACHPTRGGSTLSLTGAYFGSEAPTVRISNRECVVTSYNAVTQASLECTTPATEGKNQTILVSTGGKTASATIFNVCAPAITSITTSNGLHPTTSHVITVIGNYFSDSGIVQMNGYVCTSPTRSVASDAAKDQIVCTVVAGAGRNLPTIVTVAGQASAAALYHYDAPVLQTASIYASDTAGGALVTLTGINFGPAGTGAVTLGGRLCTLASNGWSHSEVRCYVPAGQGLGLNYTLTRVSESSTITSQLFNYSPPTLTGVSPSSIVTAGAVPITLTGTNFGVLGGATVYVQDQSPSDNTNRSCVVTFQTHTQIVCNAPQGFRALVSVSLDVSTQLAALSNSYGYDLPYMYALSPSLYSTGGSSGATDSMTITGVSFGELPGIVRFFFPEGTQDVTGAAITSWTHDRVVVKVPVGSGRDIPVRVISSVDRAHPTQNLTYSYSPASLTSISPISMVTGPESSGSRVLTINGLSFGPTKAESTLFVGELECPVISWSHSQIKCTVPVSQGINLPVALTVSGKEANHIMFSFANPVVTGVTPQNSATTGGVDITVAGTSFGDPDTASSYHDDPVEVTVGGLPCPVVGGTYTHEKIICTLPPGVGTKNGVVVKVGVLVSNSVDYVYAVPSLSSLSPTTADTEGALLTVTAYELGASISLVGVSVGGLVCVIQSNDLLMVDNSDPTRPLQSFTCLLPTGTGKNLALSLSVSDSTVTVLNQFSFNDPHNVTVSPLNWPSNGGVTMLFAGRSMSISPTFRIGSNLCLDVHTAEAHRNFTCTLMPGQGTLLALSMTIGTTTYPLNGTFSYDPPNILSVTPLTGPTAGGTVLTITGVSLGTSGSVTIGGTILGNVVTGGAACAVISGSYSHYGLRCTVPPGMDQGYAVRLQSAERFDIKVPSFEFSYDAPTVSTVSPSNGPAVGHSASAPFLLTITGINFGLATAATAGTSFVTVGGSSCPFTLWTHVRIECELPPGFDQAAVVVSVGTPARTSGTTYQYKLPALTTISPLNGPTTGSAITLTGTNLGAVSLPRTFHASLTGQAAEILIATSGATMTEVTATVGAGVGRNLPFNLFVSYDNAGVARNRTLSTSLLYNYDPPTVTAISSADCDSDVTNTKIVDCPVRAAGITITITGTNFGAPAPHAAPVAHLAAPDCVVASWTHTQIVCTAVGAVGYELDVRVAQSDASVTFAKSVSFKGPKLNGIVSPPGGVLSSTYASQEVQIAVDDAPGVYVGISVTFGPASDPAQFVCAAPSLSAGVITCTVPPGVGMDLVFVARFDIDGSLYQVSQASTGSVTYPAPAFVASSLAMFSTPLDVTDSLIGTVSQGQLLIFDMTNTGVDASLIKIYYFNSDYENECTGVQFYTPTPADPRTIQCATQASQGAPHDGYKFRAVLLNQNSSAPSTFVYAYPEPPVVGKVTTDAANCEESGDGIADCVTAGNFVITIAGSKFPTNGATVRVGQYECPLLSNTQEQILCTLPSGAGRNLAVVVTSGSTFSTARRLVSYASPVLLTITGCTASSATKIIDCSRLTQPVLTITGTNFGPTGATIYMGDHVLSVTHDAATPNSKGTFTLPQGYGLDRALLLMQAGGSSGSGLYVSYEPCPSGTYEQSAIACLPCAAGYFSNIPGTAACSPCNPGTYQLTTGRTICDQCPVGKYSADLARSSNCPDCAPGYTSVAVGQTQCTPCAAGTYRTVSMTACTSCVAGRYANLVSAATSCLSCAAGTFSSARAVTCNSCSQGTYSAAAATVCTACAIGKVQPLTGSSMCNDCVQGTYMPNTGQAVCLLCNDGTWSALGRTVCTNCVRGKYAARAPSSTVGPTVCTNCAEGYYAENEGQPACTECPLGRYTNTTGQSACLLCAEGKYGPTTARTSCQLCGIGTYQDLVGTAACKQCETGKSQHVTGQSVCLPCAQGQYAATPGHQYCDSCAMGRYADDIGSVACAPCASGRFSNAAATAQCTACPSGSYSTRIGEDVLTSCSNCVAGKFAPASGQAACTDCPLGSISAGPGRTACANCQAGTYNDELSMSVCKSCVVGTFSLAGASSCSPCPVGRYTASPGAQACVECAAGRYGATAGLSICSSCQPGRFIGVKGQSACIECPAGRYTSGSQPTVCSLCPVGKFQTSPGQSTCEDCPAGRFTASAGQANCMLCARGEYANTTGSERCRSCERGTVAGSEGLSVCEACDAGRYAPTTRLAACLDCPAGSMNTATGASACSLCTVGKHQTGEGSTMCTDCEVGRYAPALGLHTCIACKAGTFQNSTGTSTCRRCALGTFSAVSGLTACINCDAGRYAPAQEAVTCLACSRGHYQPLQGQSDCLSCPTGQIQPATGMSICSDCLAGTFQAQIGQGSCTLCGAGEYQDAPGTTSCKPCEPETYSVVTNTTAGASVCTACPAGRTQPSPGQASCNLCAPGKFTATTGCEDCPLGHYQDQSGQNSCLPCPTGTYGPDTAMLTCLPCGVGSFTNDTGRTECDKCAAGEYQDVPSSTTCKPCAAGTVTAAVGQAVCGHCPAGRYDANPSGSARTACTSCEAGKFQTDVGTTACLDCGLGYFSANVGQVDCIECPQGKYTSSYGTVECTNCELGRYSDVIGQLMCTDCATGRFAPETGSFSCTNCPAGKIQSTMGQSECVDCENGKFIDVAGRSTCSLCLPGTYAGGVGLTACADCAPGEYTAGYGEETCTSCDAGKFQVNRGRSYCNECSAGRFSPLAHAVSCSACAPGTYTGIEGQSVCVDCEAGKYQFNAGFSACDECPAGSFTAKTRQTRCSPCTSGTYANTTGFTQCTDCNPGRYSMLLGTIGPTTCSECAVGRYQIAYGQGACVECLPGRYTNNTGSLLCPQCDVGSYTADIESQECELCRAGTFSSREGSMICTECGVGYYTAAPGASACLACGAGKYQDVSGGSVCKTCPGGYYQPEPAQSYCLACPLGKHSAGDGINCNECAVGRFSNRIGVSACEACPSGAYQSETGQASCLLCSPGTYTNVSEAVGCTNCPIGKAQPYAGGVGCLSCDEGTYSPNVGQSRCRACEPGTYNTLIQGTACFGCDVGKYQTVQGQTTCHNCPAGSFSSANAVECSKCENGMANELEGQGSCVLCDPLVSTPNKEATGCDCNVGYYLPDYTSYTNLGLTRFVSGTNNFICYPCPTGADCTQVGNKWSELKTLAGWWRATNESSEFYRCAVADYCPGGVAMATVFDETSGSKCSDGRQGIMCSDCAPGLKTGIGGSCEACPDDAGSYVIMIIVLVLVVALILVSVWILWKAGEDTLKAAQRAPRQEDDMSDDEDDYDMYANASEAERAKRTRDAAASANNDNDEMVSDELHGEREAVELETLNPYSPEHVHRMLPGPPPPPPNFTYKLKIFLSFIQIATHIGTGLEIQWPSTFKEFILFFDFLNFDYIFSSITSAECYDAVDYYFSYVVFVCLPAVIIVAVMVLWILPRHFNLFCFRHQDVFQRMRSKMRSWLIILYALFLLYPVVSSTILNHYVCKTIHDSHNTYSYLLIDLAVPCKTDTWWLFAYVGVLLVIIYPVGIPAFFFFLLYSHRTRLHLGQVQAKFGFLYAGYRDGTWWWELLDTFHKLIQTSILAFFPLLVQLPVGMGVAILYLMAILLFNPYLRKEDDALAMLCQNLIFLLMLAGYFFQIEGSVKLSTSEDVGMTLSLLVAAGIFLAAFVYYIGRALWQVALELRQKFCPKKATPKDLAQLMPDPTDADTHGHAPIVAEEDITSGSENDSDDDESSFGDRPHGDAAGHHSNSGSERGSHGDGSSAAPSSDSDSSGGGDTDANVDAPRSPQMRTHAPQTVTFGGTDERSVAYGDESDSDLCDVQTPQDASYELASN